MISFCTSNEGKFIEVSQVLKEFNIPLQRIDVELVEPKVFSLQEVALAKARQAFENTKQPVLVEDTGIFFLDYNEFPGAFTKIFVSSVGLQGVLRLVEGTSRNAVFKTVVAFKDENTEKTFEGSVSGRISEKPVGKSHEKLPFDSVFIPEGWSKTFAEGSEKEKNATSHRSNAFRAFAEWYKK